jgi:hypothetical protein
VSWFLKTTNILIFCSLARCTLQLIEPKKLESKKLEIDAQQYGEKNPYVQKEASWPAHIKKRL